MSQTHHQMHQSSPVTSPRLPLVPSGAALEAGCRSRSSSRRRDTAISSDEAYGSDAGRSFSRDQKPLITINSWFINGYGLLTGKFFLGRNNWSLGVPLHQGKGKTTCSPLRTVIREDLLAQTQPGLLGIGCELDFQSFMLLL